MDLVERIDQTIAARKLLREGQAVLVAVSGGLDSMVLLHLLHALARDHRWRLVVAHFNHQLRGSESDRDERFVRAAAKRLGLEFICERWNRNQHQDVRKFGMEMAARLARHDFFGRLASRMNISTVALAHHADDQAELFFLRLFRGSGGEGLAGMKWTSDGIAPVSGSRPVRLVRPFLAQRKDELRAVARARGIQFREDSSNARVQHERNRIRHKLLPLLARQFDPSIAAIVLRAMEILGEESDYVRSAAEKWLRGGRRARFEELHTAVQRQCVRMQLGRLFLTPKFELIEQLRLFPNKSMTAGPRCTVHRGDDGLLQKRDETKLEFNRHQIFIELTGRRGVRRFDGVLFRWQIEPRRGAARPLRAMAGRECFNAVKVGPGIMLRHWRQGDRFQPIGLRQEVKLQDLFTNLKIPATRRRELVVAETLGGKIFWVEGLRISEQFKLDVETSTRLKWRWQRCESP